MSETHVSRRGLLAASAALGAGFGAGTAQAAEPKEDTFEYEVQRSEAEWRARLSDEEYDILRNRGTEWPQSSAYWDDYRAGEFRCKGCGLHVYSSEWRVELDKGWVFFSHSQPTAILTDIDKAANYSMNPNASRTLIEAHCRRCGSHMGHVLVVDRQLVHCVNGASLTFEPQTA